MHAVDFHGLCETIHLYQTQECWLMVLLVTVTHKCWVGICVRWCNKTSEPVFVNCHRECDTENVTSRFGFVWLCVAWNYPLPKGVTVHVFCLALFVELPVIEGCTSPCVLFGFVELPVTEGCPSPCVLFGFVVYGITRYRRVSQSMCFVWLCLWSYPYRRVSQSMCFLWLCLWSYPLPKGVPAHVFSLALFVELPVTEGCPSLCVFFGFFCGVTRYTTITSNM